LPPIPSSKFEDFPNLQRFLQEDEQPALLLQPITTAAQALQSGTTAQVATPKNEQQNRHTPQWQSNAHEQPDVNQHSVQGKARWIQQLQCWPPFHYKATTCWRSTGFRQIRFCICNGLFTKISWISATGFATAARQRQQRKPNKEELPPHR
jgi:hypothetical protein